METPQKTSAQLTIIKPSLESDNDKSISNNANNPELSKHTKSTRLQDITQKVSPSYTTFNLTPSQTTRTNVFNFKLDTVIKQITCSNAQRANFKQVANLLKMNVKPLIAGYGIQWNIKYQSYRRAIDAREVIDHILKEDQEKNQSGLFADAHFSPRD